MKKLTRREWATLTATGSLLLAGASLLPRAFAATDAPRGGPARNSGFKISLNAFSFNRALTAPASGGPPEMTLFAVLDFCAARGFDGFDPTAYYFPG